MRVGLAGDVMLGRKVDRLQQPRPPEHVWGSVRDRLGDPDGLVGAQARTAAAASLIVSAVSQCRIHRTTACGRTGTQLQQSRSTRPGDPDSGGRPTHFCPPGAFGR